MKKQAAVHVKLLRILNFLYSLSTPKEWVAVRICVVKWVTAIWINKLI